MIPQGVSPILHHHEGDLPGFHALGGFHRQGVGADADGIGGHDMPRGEGQRVAAHPLGALERPPDVAVADHPGQDLALHDRGHAQLAQGHGLQGFHQAGLGGHLGELGVHQVPDLQQPGAEVAGRVELGEVLQGEAALHHVVGGQQVAPDQLQGGAGHGREIERAALPFGQRVGEAPVRRLAQAAVRLRGDGADLHAQAHEAGQEPDDLLALAAVAEDEHGVLGHDHAQVAVQGVGRVQVEAGAAGGRQGRGDLLGHEAGLAHARKHQPAPAGGHVGGPGAHQGFVPGGFQRLDGPARSFQHMPGRLGWVGSHGLG